MRESDQGALTAVEWAVKKYWKSKTDSQLARGLNVSEEEVVEMRQQLGLERPKGEESLKAFARRYLMEMSDVEKKEFMKSLSPELIFKMAEGNPHSSASMDVNVEPITVDITHQLLKTYGPELGTSPVKVLEHSEGGGLPEGAGE